jgi:hypothetical protein
MDSIISTNEFENLKTMNERLEFLNFIETKIEHDTDLFFNLIDSLKKKYTSANNESLILCINEILTKIDLVKSIQTQNAYINNTSKVVYNNNEYTISEILKIKEGYKNKIDRLKSFSAHLEETDLTDARMAVRLKLYDLTDEIRKIHKIINQFNNKDLYE